MNTMNTSSVGKHCIVVLNVKLQVKVKFKTFQRLSELLDTAFTLNATIKTVCFAQIFCISQHELCNLRTGNESLTPHIFLFIRIFLISSISGSNQSVSQSFCMELAIREKQHLRLLLLFNNARRTQAWPNLSLVGLEQISRYKMVQNQSVFSQFNAENFKLRSKRSFTQWDCRIL